MPDELGGCCGALARMCAGMLIDGLEDQLVNNEKKELESIMEDLQTQEHKRSRLRVSEVLRIVDEVSAVQIDEVVAADREYE